MSSIEYDRYRRQLLIASVKNFWRLFRKKKMGIAGLVFLIYFAAIAVAAPWLTPFHPIKDQDLAEPQSPPEWAAIIPDFAELPRNTLLEIAPERFQRRVAGSEQKISFATGDRLALAYRNPEHTKAATAVALTFPFAYNTKAPRTFVVNLKLDITNAIPFDIYSDTGLKVDVAVNVTRMRDGATFRLFQDVFFRSGGVTQTIYSNDQRLLEKNRLKPTDNLAQKIFARKGEYQLDLRIWFVDGGAASPREATVTLGQTSFRIKGMSFGLLGTNYLGQDMWSQFVWGSRASLIVGLLVAAVSLMLGVVIGTVAGYKGGFADRILIFAADTTFFIPLLPIILLVLLLMGPQLYLIVFLIAVFIWAGLARELRAWVLSLKERPFVDAARAIGCSDTHIMFRYILPQTAPFLMYQFVIRVPQGILIEAGLSLLGFGDPLLPSWGQMLNQAWFGGAVLKGAWWWMTPPIAGLLFVALAFVFIGFTVDEILNPRLRLR